MRINQATVDLVKRWEGFRANAYLCPAGVWTVGYGTTTGAIPGLKVGPGMSVSREEADEYLRSHLAALSRRIRPAITAPVNENELGAFLSLAYNIGVGAFLGSSALRHFNAGDKAKAAAAIKLWNKATVNGKRQVLKGLVDRREDEVRLFMAQVSSQPQPAPTATKPPALGLLARLLAWFTGARQ
jgi:lysozyme